MLTETQLTIQLPVSQHPANTTTAHHPPSTKNQQPQSSNCLWVTPPQFYSLLHDVRRYGILLAQFRPAVLAPPCPLPPHHKGSGSCQPAVWPGARWAPSCSNKQFSGTLLTLHTHTHTRYRFLITIILPLSQQFWTAWSILTHYLSVGTGLKQPSIQKRTREAVLTHRHSTRSAQSLWNSFPSEHYHLNDSMSQRQ